MNFAKTFLGFTLALSLNARADLPVEMTTEHLGGRVLNVGIATVENETPGLISDLIALAGAKGGDYTLYPLSLDVTPEGQYLRLYFEDQDLKYSKGYLAAKGVLAVHLRDLLAINRGRVEVQEKSDGATRTLSYGTIVCKTIIRKIGNDVHCKLSQQ